MNSKPFAFVFLLNFLCKGIRDCTRCLNILISTYRGRRLKEGGAYKILKNFRGRALKIGRREIKVGRLMGDLP